MGPLSICVLNKATVVLAGLFLIPFAAFVGSLWRKWNGLEDSASECFRRTLLEPTDWFQLWRLNCRLASMVALATKSSDFEMEDKSKFIKTCMDKNIPVTPVMDMPKTLIAKDVLEEGGMGIHVLKNVLHGGRWILQEKLENCDDVKELLPEGAPLSTMRVLTGSHGALDSLGSHGGQGIQVKTLATVWRAGRQGASTDHSCVMVNVPSGKTSDKLGCASTSAHWYARGCKSLGMPVSTKDGSIRAHPDMMPGVPLAGWDVAFCPPKDGSKEPELVLLEANLSCNFFRGSIAWDDYASLLDRHFQALDQHFQDKKAQ